MCGVERLPPETTMTTHTDEDAAAAPEELLRELVRRHFHIDTLETRDRDSLDFHEVAVWSVRTALEEAYRAGRAAR
jgi:hypothetical protein